MSLCSRLDEAADEDRLDHENNKRRHPMPTETVLESRSTECRENADGLDFERFEDLVLPSSQSCFDAIESREESRDNDCEGKTLFVNIASGGEAEDEAETEQAMARSLFQGE